MTIALKNNCNRIKIYSVKISKFVKTTILLKSEMLSNILGIKQSRDHVKNESQCNLIDQAQLRERLLKLTGHYIRMPNDEPVI